MGFSISARMRSILGATLMAAISPQVSIAEDNSSETRSISGGGVSSISGGGVNSISGGGVSSISGGGVNSISGGGINSISGGGVDSISGGGISSISGGGINSISGGGINSISGGGVVLAGPVDSIDRINGVFESMGQIVMASQNMLAGMNVGDYVSVGGSVVSPGWLYADGVRVSAQQYVPGATEVFVTGMLSSVDLAHGTAQMGDLTIDYTSSLSNADAPAGAMWSFAGTQPAARGMMVSDRSGAR